MNLHRTYAQLDTTLLERVSGAFSQEPRRDRRLVLAQYLMVYSRLDQWAHKEGIKPRWVHGRRCRPHEIITTRKELADRVGWVGAGTGSPGHTSLRACLDFAWPHWLEVPVWDRPSSRGLRILRLCSGDRQGILMAMDQVPDSTLRSFLLADAGAILGGIAVLNRNSKGDVAKFAPLVAKLYDLYAIARDRASVSSYMAEKRSLIGSVPPGESPFQNMPKLRVEDILRPNIPTWLM